MRSARFCNNLQVRSKWKIDFHFLSSNFFLEYIVLCRFVHNTFIIVGRRGRTRIVVRYTTTFVICAYVSSNLAQARFTLCTLCDKVCQCLAACRWFSLGTRISSTNNWNIVKSDVKHNNPTPNGTWNNILVSANLGNHLWYFNLWLS